MLIVNRSSFIVLADQAIEPASSGICLIACKVFLAIHGVLSFGSSDIENE